MLMTESMTGVVTPTALPIDPDDLPIAVYQTPEEHEMVERLLTNRFGVAEQPPATEPAPESGQRQLGLGALAGRLLRRAS